MSGRERRVNALTQRVNRLRVPKQIADQFGRFKDDPTGFCTGILGVASATRRSDGSPYQFEVLDALVTEQRVAVRSGHGVGKTGVDAWAALWWLTTRPFSRVIILAPEYSRQVRAVIFSEMRKWARRAVVKLPLQVLASRVLVEGYGEEWSATGMSAAGDPSRLEGFHAEGGLLLICDEMKGIPQESFDAVQGALSGLEEARLLVTSVPGGAGSGPFWKSCEDTDHWRVHHLPSTDSSLVSPRWCADRAREWGKDSPLYQSRVEGAFAEAGDGVLYPLGLLEKATTPLPLEALGDGKPNRAGLGVDVSRSIAGDLNSIGIVQGGLARVLKTFRSPDLMVTVQKVMQTVAESGVKQLSVDVGGVGAGVADRLKEQGYQVHDVHFGGGARDPQRFKNRRAEMGWEMRQGMEEGTVRLDPADEELLADLSAIRYAFAQDGRIQLESKDQVRDRLGRSPDRADCLWLALSEAGVIGRRDAPAVEAIGITNITSPWSRAATRQRQFGGDEADRMLKSTFYDGGGGGRKWGGT